jgi:hypothetical protein
MNKIKNGKFMKILEIVNKIYPYIQIIIGFIISYLFIDILILIKG